MRAEGEGSFAFCGVVGRGLLLVGYEKGESARPGYLVGVLGGRGEGDWGVRGMGVEGLWKGDLDGAGGLWKERKPDLVGVANGLEGNAGPNEELGASGRASAWLINVNVDEAEEEEEGLRYRKWAGCEFCGVSLGRSKDERVGEDWGERYNPLTIALLPGIGSGRL